LKLRQILFSQGFGTRRQCDALLASGAVAVGGVAQCDGNVELTTDGLVLNVSGVDWPFHERAYVMLHKPAGYECSHQPKHWPSVYELLPEALRNRPSKSSVNGVQAVGRLDQDTTGLLILSDDGQFIHRMASPKHHVPKVYEVTTRHPVTDADIAALRAGVVLNDDPEPVVAAACERVAATQLRLTLTEGKYHQVKRMIAAVGNRVEALHRSQIGGLSLGPALRQGQWQWMSPDDLVRLRVETASHGSRSPV